MSLVLFFRDFSGFNEKFIIILWLILFSSLTLFFKVVMIE